MTTNLTIQDLINFETDIGECFKKKMILAPIHLYNGNEETMINIFKSINDNDWVLCTWRSHYQCLLKGIPIEQLKNDILKGKSISLCYSKYKILSSAIVTGIIPIATGIAFDIKRKKLKENVYCFIGDMTAETGCFSENYKYSINFDLPITWIIEDNEKSVCTDTKKTWNQLKSTYENNNYPKIIYYKYKTIYPHAGPGGERIQF